MYTNIYMCVTSISEVYTNHTLTSVPPWICFQDLVFAILIADRQLVTLVRLKKYFLHPLDLHLIFNLVTASESFKSAESWTPICLPKFDPG